MLGMIRFICVKSQPDNDFSNVCPFDYTAIAVSAKVERS